MVSTKGAIVSLLVVIISSSTQAQSIIYIPVSSGSYSSSYSSSSSGSPPVTYTYSTGNGHATATAGGSQPAQQYYQVGVSRPTRAIHRPERTDAQQQIYKKDPPPGLLNSGFAEFAPPPSFAGVSSQSSASADAFQGGSSFFKPGATAYGPPAQGAGNFAGAQAQAQAAAVPHFAYGPPAKGDSGNDLSIQMIHPPPARAPHVVYGVPETFVPQFSPAASKTDSVSETQRELIFIPAFPDGSAPDFGAELSPPGGGFIPPDGALLSPPAPLVNNVPLPQPRLPIRHFQTPKPF